MKRVVAISGLLSSWALSACAIEPAPLEPSAQTSSALTAVADFGDNPGKLEMHVYAPAHPLAAQPPLVVALHGCTQSADDYQSAGWNELAEAQGFYVVYPGQTTANNPTRCFRWYDSAQTTRGQGEVASIAQMVSTMRARYGVGRVFVTGLSAGAAMTSSLLAAYPDVFEAGAIFSGIAAGCARTQLEAFSCMNPGVTRDAAAWATAARAAYPGYAGAFPRVAVFHGDADYTVRPSNLDAIVAQWTELNGVSASAPAKEQVEGATHAKYTDASGRVRVESFLVAGMGHGVPVDPSSACGKAGAYFVSEKLCGTARAAQLFGLGADSAPSTSAAAGSADAGSTSSGRGAGSGGCSVVSVRRQRGASGAFLAIAVCVLAFARRRVSASRA